jgi:stalled ribosome rescue protein Dom34
MSSHHAITVWIDHQEARIFQIDARGAEESLISAPPRHVHRHPKGPTAEHNHPEDMRHFFHDVADALRNADQILLVGPSTAKLQLLRYLHEHARVVEAKVVGIETVDHPTDRQLAAYAMKYFKLAKGGAATQERRL